MLTLVSGDRGYQRVKLGSRVRATLVQYLVAEAFLGPRPDGMWLLHRNDIRSDNRASNLYWGSPRQNTQDMIDNGHHENSNKVICKRGHQLIEPNLLEGPARLKGRSCRACRLALLHFHNGRRRKGWPAPTPEQMQAEADCRYAAIMA